jgi:predicted MPP superfamily phosphohydrolase
MGAGTVAIGLAGYSGLVEPNEVDVSRIDVKIDRLPPAFDQFRIAIISDLHFGPYTGEHEIGAAVNAANQLKPDMVAILGDFVTEPLTGDLRVGAKKAEPCAKTLKGLQTPLGSFAVLGNHDYVTDPELVADALQTNGIAMLRNTNQAIERQGQRIWLLGLNDAVEGRPDLDRALQGVPADEPKILLVHEPDYADHASQFGIDVQLSGHSHGGQIRFPGIHPLWLPEMARKYYRGYYRVRGLQLYTNRGIGTVGVPFRFLASPEVTLMTLRAA